MKAWWRPGIVILVVALVIAGLTYQYGYKSEYSYWQGIAVESAGVVLEVLLLVILLGAYEHWRRRSDDITKLRSRIDDFKCWDNEYARNMIASTLRKLAEKKVTDIDFRGSRLSMLNFHAEGIESLKDSVFSDGLWLDEVRNNFGYIKHVNFSFVDCRNVKFSVGNLSLATYENCEFFNTDLRGAVFTGAKLKWNDKFVRADEAQWYVADEMMDGQQSHTQEYFPVFAEADLEQTNFDGCSFEYADFRGAKNILKASFIGAKGIDTCFFDEGVIEKIKVRC